MLKYYIYFKKLLVSVKKKLDRFENFICFSNNNGIINDIMLLQITVTLNNESKEQSWTKKIYI